MHGMNCSTQSAVRTEAAGHVHGLFDWTETLPSEAVCSVIDAATPGETRDVDPLYESVDPDAMDQLLQSDGYTDSHELSFTHAGLQIDVHGDGHVVATSTRE